MDDNDDAHDEDYDPHDDDDDEHELAELWRRVTRQRARNMAKCRRYRTQNPEKVAPYKK